MEKKQAADLTGPERARRWQAIARAAAGQEPRNRAERRALAQAQKRAARRGQ